MRLFVAVAIPDEVAGELEAAVAPLRESWPGLRWTRREAWHLTLAFLGEVNEAVVARLTLRLERAAARHASLSLALGGAGTFPGAAKARVLWTGVHGERRELGALAASVAAGARRAGAPPAEEGRRFQPHLTLARCRAPVDARDLVTGQGEVGLEPPALLGRRRTGPPRTSGHRGGQPAQRPPLPLHAGPQHPGPRRSWERAGPTQRQGH